MATSKNNSYRENLKKIPLWFSTSMGKRHDKIERANFFNSFFTTIANTLASKPPPPINKYTTSTAIIQNFFKNNDTKLRIPTLSPDYILRELMKLRTNKSTGPDKLPTRFLKDGAEIIANPLTYIINLSITTSTVPRAVKEALVTPIHKKGDKLNVTNYRPVSTLCIVSKIYLKMQFTLK